MKHKSYITALQRYRKNRGKKRSRVQIDPVQLEADIQQLRIEIAELEKDRTDEERAADPLTQEIIKLEKEIAELQAG